MKTSNKLIIAAVVLVLLSLIGYDYLLKGIYISGDYKDPFHNFIPLKFKDFDTVDIVSSTAVNVKFVQGPFSVKVDSKAIDYTLFKQTGHSLQINAVFEQDYLHDANPFTILISCPKLPAVIANATYRANNMEVTDTIVRNDWNMREVLIEGFKQDSLNISQDYGSTVILSNDHIGLVSATIGRSPKSGSKLVILENNQIQTTNLNILNNSKLFLNKASIGDLHYHLADSAKMIVTGKAQDLLDHTKPNQK